jgi:hypothetical protein
VLALARVFGAPLCRETCKHSRAFCAITSGFTFVLSRHLVARCAQNRCVSVLGGFSLRA